jgi:hypothetical protein
LISRFDYEDFLACSLNEAICQEYLEQDDRALMAMQMIAAGGSEVGESTMELYTEPLAIQEHILVASMAYFVGADFLKIICDCSSQDFCMLHTMQGHPWFSVGKNERLSENERYIMLKENIRRLGISFFGEG